MSFAYLKLRQIAGIGTLKRVNRTGKTHANEIMIGILNYKHRPNMVLNP